MAEMMNPEQAMMQGAMGSALAEAGNGIAPEAGITNTGDATPEERAGVEGDTILGHLTPGEIVIPKDLIDDEVKMRKLSKMFEEFNLDINQYTVGHETNSINEETGYPEFGWNPLKKVKRALKKATKWVTGKRAEEKAIDRARSQATAQYEARQLMIKQKTEEAMAYYQGEKEAVASRMLKTQQKGSADMMVQRKGFEEKLSSWAKIDAEIGPAGVVDVESAPDRPVPSSGSRNRRRKRKPQLPRRPL
jgi:hypothetical protein